MYGPISAIHKAFRLYIIIIIVIIIVVVIIIIIIIIIIKTPCYLSKINH